MIIKIPNIFYEIEVKDTKNCPNQIKDFLADGYLSCVTKSKNRSTIWIKHPIKTTDIPTLGHEIIHCLQNISERRDMSFIREQEFFAYTFQYLLNEILGYEFK
jgi:hypothetical protein